MLLWVFLSKDSKQRLFMSDLSKIISTNLQVKYIKQTLNMANIQFVQ